VVDRASSGLFPQLEASVRGESNRLQTQFQESQILQLGISSQYEIDLWGRINSNLEAQRYRADASLADYRTAALSLSAEVARTWFSLMEAHGQLRLVNQQIETNEKVLKLLQTRFGTGQIRSADILRQRQLLESTREQRISVESRIQLLEHRLSVLLGKPPQKSMNYTRDSLPELPPLPETGIPSELVRRRPDIRSAYRLLQAADREVASAISNQFPRISLSASLSTADLNGGNLFEDWGRSLAGNVIAPLFYGGQLSAEVDRNQAVKKQRLYQYGQSILTAFREVEDALAQEKNQREKIQSIRNQLEIARQAYEQLRIEYFNGMGNYLDVLTALDEVQQLQRDLLTAKMVLLEYRIALYRSLAGGFETTRENQELSKQ
jgi:NodT family efflux transporter outer membrane factor (OMF) lipoprotein